METQGKIRIILADDHEIMCEGLRYLVDRQDDMEVVGHAATGDQVVEIAETLNPDVIAMDISMPVMDGIEATTRLRANGCQAKILVLSAVLTRHTIDQAIASGVTGLMMKESLLGMKFLNNRTLLKKICYMNKRNLVKYVIDQKVVDCEKVKTLCPEIELTSIMFNPSSYEFVSRQNLLSVLISVHPWLRN